MLTAIRDRATGLIAWIVVILLIIPFAFWGIQSYFGGGGPVNVATVNGTAISKEALNTVMQRELEASKQILEGKAAEQFQAAVLEQMIRNEVLAQAAENAGLRISNGYLAASIRAAPEFQRDGKFDEQLYTRLLYSNNFTKQSFEAQQRRDLLLQQLASGVMQTEFVTPRELNEIIRLRDRELQLSYMIIPQQKFLPGVKVSADRVAAYYDQHHAQFMTPEQVKLQYLELDQRAIEASIPPPTEKQLRAQYAQQKASFVTPEQRRAAHILIAVDQHADAAAVAAAKKKAQQIYDRIEAGESFAKLAKKYSDDPGSADKGGDLGVIAKGTLSASFDKALFSLKKKGDVSKPVRTPYGFHIIELTGLTPSTQKSFAQVRDVLLSDYRAQQAENNYYTVSQRLLDLTYENPLTLEVAAQELGLKIGETGWITRKGTATGVGSYPKVVQAAFSKDVLAGGDLKNAVNSKMIELNRGEGGTSDNRAVVVRVKAYQPSGLRPLDKVRGQIERRLRNDAARDKAREIGQTLVKALRAGKAMESLAASHALKVVSTGYVRRDDRKQIPELIAAAFRMGKPSVGHPVYGGTELPSGDFTVIAVTGLKEGDPAKTPEASRKLFAQLISNLYGRVDMQNLVDGLRRAADVKIFKDKLNLGDDT